MEPLLNINEAIRVCRSCNHWIHVFWDEGSGTATLGLCGFRSGCDPEYEVWSEEEQTTRPKDGCAEWEIKKPIDPNSLDNQSHGNP